MKFIIGNWKMNGTESDQESILRSLKNVQTKNTIVMCFPFTLLYGNNYGITIGAQDISQFIDGSHTGDISGKMLKDAGVKYVIVGHSDRRITYNETNKIVRDKATIAIKNGIIPIICVGETADEKNAGRTMSVVKKMVLESIPNNGKFIIAYEPRWAIGTGKTPTDAEIAAVHQTIFKALSTVKRESTPIVYGGSVNAKNAANIIKIPHVDGVLVGGASLKSDTFVPIIKSID